VQHAHELTSIDFFVVPTARVKVLFVLVVLVHDRRRIIHFNVTEHPTAQWTRPLAVLPTGKERILILSTDPDIRSTVQELLEVLGYSTTLVSKANDAYQILKHEHIDLLMTEAVPGPGVSVRELLSNARQAVPNVRTIIMGDEPTSEISWNRPEAEVMVKPFSLADLANTVRHVLDKRS